MSTPNWSGRGSYTNHFTSIAAGAVLVRGLAAGSAGSNARANPVLSSSPGVFAVGPDLAQILTGAVTPTWIPSRPASSAVEQLAA